VAINAIGSIGAAFNTAALQRAGEQHAVQGTAKNDFGSVIVDALEGLQATQNHADSLAVKAATGDLNDVHDYMIAAAEASLATEFTVAVRNRAVEAFNEIMRMQV
jgi:flagellar hook-basal body complex protein FliE